MSASLNYGFRRGYVTTFGLILGIWTQMLGVGLGTTASKKTVPLGLSALIIQARRIIERRVRRTPLLDAQQHQISHPEPLDQRKGGTGGGHQHTQAQVHEPVVAPAAVDRIIALTLGFTDLMVMADYTALASRVLGASKSPPIFAP